MFPRKLHRYEVYGVLYAVCEIDTYAPQKHMYVILAYKYISVQSPKKKIHISSKSQVIIIQVTVRCHNKPTNEPLPRRVGKHVDLGEVNHERLSVLAKKNQIVSL